MTITMRLLLIALLAVGLGTYSAAQNNKTPLASPAFEGEAARRQLSEVSGITLPASVEILGYEVLDETLRLKKRLDFQALVEIASQMPLEAMLMSAELRPELGDDAGWWDVDRYGDIIASSVTQPGKGQIKLGLSTLIEADLIEADISGELLLYLLFEPL